MHQYGERETVVLARATMGMDWAYWSHHVRELFTQWAADHLRIHGHDYSDLGC